MRSNRTIATILLGTLALGCSEEQAPVQPTPDYLAGSTWRLAAVEDQRNNPVFIPAPDDRYEIRFLAGGSVQVETNCFECTGTYRVTRGWFPIVEFSISCEAIACEADSGYPAYLEELNGLHEGGEFLGRLELLVEGSWHWLVHDNVTDEGG